jgi:hypothetical protein
MNTASDDESYNLMPMKMLTMENQEVKQLNNKLKSEN